MPILKYISAFAISITILSCGSSLNGTIETREGNKVYLVNGSKTKELSFTVKMTIIRNDSIIDYETAIFPLVAGDEKYIGKTDSITPLEYPKIEKDILKTIKIVNKDFFVEDLKTKAPDNLPPFIPKLRDTILNGEQYSYYYTKENVLDSLRPFPTNKYKFKYIVTGESERKDKQNTATNN